MATLTAVAWTASAMGIRQERKLLARATNGTSALYELRGWGPEGGESLTYRLEGKARRKSVDFLVSSTFSPGDGSQPQTVSTAVCEQRLSTLSDELSKRGIQGVAVNVERCRNPDRDGLVTVAK